MSWSDPSSDPVGDERKLLDHLSEADPYADLDECPHSMVLTPDTCALCKEAKAGPPPKTEIVKDGHPFPAKFGSQCPSCNLPVTPRQIIQRWSDGLYRHAEGNHPCKPYPHS